MAKAAAKEAELFDEVVRGQDWHWSSWPSGGKRAGKIVFNMPLLIPGVFLFTLSSAAILNHIILQEISLLCQSVMPTRIVHLDWSKL